MPNGDRPESPADHPHAHQHCTREEHEQLKRNARNFRRNTRFVGVHGSDGKRRELRNCTRCGSTLTAPRKKPSKARRTVAP